MLSRSVRVSLDMAATPEVDRRVFCLNVHVLNRQGAMSAKFA
jgi:hypothetical protein